jgi:hypothetical protein
MDETVDLSLTPMMKCVHGTYEDFQQVEDPNLLIPADPCPTTYFPSFDFNVGEICESCNNGFFLNNCDRCDLTSDGMRKSCSVCSPGYMLHTP